MIMKSENKGLKGAVIGDIVGSRFEWDNIKSKEFELFSSKCDFTDDSVMSIAVAKAFMNSAADGTALNIELVAAMQTYGRIYPNRGYGGRFKEWIKSRHPEPYKSWGNGAPMRCSAAGMLAKSAEEAWSLGEQTALPTHNHNFALTAAGLTATMIYEANHGASMEELRGLAESRYDVPKCDELRPGYSFDVSSQGTMPAALAAFLESSSFEDAIRNAISLGGDSDTIAAITGSIAEAYWGVPDEIWMKASQYLDSHLRKTVKEFYTFANEGDSDTPFKVEPHMHTAETSDCAKSTAAEMMEVYSMRGFSTVVVTDHFSRNYLKYCPAETYEDKVEMFFEGYNAAKKAGDRYGITVLFGAEFRLKGNRNHYLVYGLTKDFLLKHPEITDLSIKEFYPLARENGMLVIQAHPFRKSCFPTPDCVDGMELRNANPKHYLPEEERYIEKIASGYGLIQTGGSDTHVCDAAGLSGIYTAKRIETMDELIEVFRTGAFEII